MSCNPTAGVPLKVKKPAAEFRLLVRDIRSLLANAVLFLALIIKLFPLQAIFFSKAVFWCDKQNLILSSFCTFSYVNLACRTTLMTQMAMRMHRLKTRLLFFFFSFWLTAHDCFLSCFGITRFMKVHAACWVRSWKGFPVQLKGNFLLSFCSAFTSIRLWESCDLDGLELTCRSLWHFLPTESSLLSASSRLVHTSWVWRMLEIDSGIFSTCISILHVFTV